MERQDVVRDSFLSLLAEMVLDEALSEYKQRHLYQMIDKALADGDEKRFLELSTELKLMLQET